METVKLDTYSIVLLSFAGLSILVLVVLLFVDPMSFFVVALLLAILGFILFYFGFIQVKNTHKEVDVLYTTAPTPEGVVSSENMSHHELHPESIIVPEVFHVADNVFTYEESRAVCKAYDAELASYSQVEQAYNSGAEWCGYGWTEGGIALFPTQQSTWEKLQKEQDPEKRIECGRPGINGGYFEPTMKFGVNCFGVKPNKKITQKMSAEDSAMNRLIGHIKDRLDKLFVSPFNDKVWSQPRQMTIEPSHTNTDLASHIKDIRSNVRDATYNVFGKVWSQPRQMTIEPSHTNTDLASHVKDIRSNVRDATYNVFGKVSDLISGFKV
jgi:Extracellular link domain